MNRKIFLFLTRIYRHMAQTTHDAESRIIPFSIFCFIAFPLFYLINLYILPDMPYENIIPRLLISVFSLLLILKSYWPPVAKKFLPFIWYFAITFSMPFFVTLMLFKNEGASSWVMNLLSVIVLITLLVDWLSYIFILIFGVIFGWFAYFMTTNKPFVYTPGTLGLSDIINTFSISIIMAIIFSQKKEKVERDKLEALMAVGASIAHELRTPLLSIDSAISGIKKFLPPLIETYEIAKINGLPVPLIRKPHYEQLGNVMEEITKEVRYSNIIIDMLLYKISSNIQPDSMVEVLCIVDCVEEAIRRYPFKGKEKKLIHFNKTKNFIFLGGGVFVVHALFNLLKNSLYFIEEQQRGEIFIWIDNDESFNHLYFKDTAKGISEDIFSTIFTRFFSTTKNGTGLGLSYCKLVMESLGGKIICKSKEFHYVEFVLSFPKIKAS